MAAASALDRVSVAGVATAGAATAAASEVAAAGSGSSDDDDDNEGCCVSTCDVATGRMAAPTYSTAAAAAQPWAFEEKDGCIAVSTGTVSSKATALPQVPPGRPRRVGL
jgi:hypothetical protein